MLTSALFDLLIQPCNLSISKGQVTCVVQYSNYQFLFNFNLFISHFSFLNLYIAMENKYYFTLNMFATKGSENNDSMYNPCDLQVIMKTGKALPEGTLCDFYLYGDNYTLMGYARQKNNSDSYAVEKRKIDAIINIWYPWTEGKYTLLANIIRPADKGRAEKIKTIKVNFVVMDVLQYEDEMKIHIDSTEVCKGITPEVALAQRLNEEAAPAWCSYNFHRLPGMYPLKFWIVRRKQWEMVDGLLEEGRPNPVSFCNNYVVKTKTMTMIIQAVMRLKLAAFNEFKKFNINCATLYDDLTPSDPYHKVREMFNPNDASNDIYTTMFGARKRGKEFYFIYNIGILSTPKGEPILNALKCNVMCNSPEIVIFMVGTEQEVDALFKADPSMYTFFPLVSWGDAGYLSYPEILRYMYSWIKVEKMNLSTLAEIVLKGDIRTAYKSGAIAHWTIDDMNDYIRSVLKPRYTNRVTSNIDVKDLLSQTGDILVKVEDFDRSYFLGKETADEILNRIEEQQQEEEEAEQEEEEDDFETMLNDFIYKMGEDACSDADSNTAKSDDGDADIDADIDIDNDDDNDDVDADDDDGFDSSPTSFTHEIDPDEEEEMLAREPKVKFQVLSPIKNPKEELNKLVGCSDIKQRIEQLTMLSRYNKVMKKVNPEGKSHEISLHSIFFGRPGTGKTTICKIMGSLLKRSGALSRGHVVLCSRKDFVGTRWGDEERTVRQAIEEAQGGVLMIDEAYQLNSSNPWDPGKLVIPLLMDILSDEKQRDIAIVLCGYKDEMKKLLELNPGLNSRFPNVYEFKDFTIEELLEITRRRVAEYGYEFTKAAWRKYRTIIEEAYEVRDAKTWGNARFVANLLEKTYLNHAMRCMKKGNLDRRHLMQITPADVQPIEVAKPKPRIGF